MPSLTTTSTPPPQLADDRIIEICLRGERLYGDDFTPEQIARWYVDEQEGYANLGAKDEKSYRYYYHAMNRLHGYRHLPERRFARALGVGSAYGDEFEPIAPRVDHFTILEPSQQMRRESVFGKPAQWVPPKPSGDMPFDSNTFDLITCFAVLHHVPNVTHVVGEIGRVLAPGGFALIHEPVTSMGDWRQARGGLTMHERGIPPGILDAAVDRAGLRIVRRAMHTFRPWTVLAARMGLEVYNVDWCTRVDALLSQLFLWNTVYHPTRLRHRFRPVCVYYVLTK
jgi:SAM-dependent methyltransferase